MSFAKSFKFLIGIFSVTIIFLNTQAYPFFDNFDSGKLGEHWKKSPAGQDVAWTIEKGVLVFSGAGGHSQMMTGNADWKDYTVECEIRLPTLLEWPGGIRTYVDTQTGGHYAVWVYPVQKMIRLYSGTAWDINVGIVTLGEFKPFDPKTDEFFYIKVVHKGKRIEVWYGEKKESVKKIIEADDDKYKSGLFACDGWDKPIHFDNILITGPGIPRSPGEVAVNSQGKLPDLWGELKNVE